MFTRTAALGPLGLIFLIASNSTEPPAAGQPAPTASTPSVRPIEARVDPRVELLSLVFRLAGNPEYNMPVSISQYSLAVEERFEDFRDHPVVTMARRLRSQHGVSYDAVMTMALHLDRSTTLAERIPFDQPPERMDKRWKPAEAREFVAKLRDFVRESDFEGFLREQAGFHRQAAERLGAAVNQRDYVSWFDRFFGPRQNARFAVLCGLLCGGGNYGVGVRFPDGGEEISPVLGAFRFDADGLPVYDQAMMVDLVVHELCHTYTNSFVDRHADALEAAGQQLFAGCREQMERQAYGNWRTMLYESLVRACVVRYRQEIDGPAAGADQARSEEARGFRWTGELAALLGEYAAERETYPDFESFMPRVIEFFDAYVEREPALQAAPTDAPRVVALAPANNAADVDPAVNKLVIQFDRPMQDKSWSLVRVQEGGFEFPEMVGRPSYDAARRKLTIQVRLAPATRYRLWLNRDQFRGFQSESGRQLSPVEWTFSTR